MVDRNAQQIMCAYTTSYSVDYKNSRYVTMMTLPGVPALGVPTCAEQVSEQSHATLQIVGCEIHKQTEGNSIAMLAGWVTLCTLYDNIAMQADLVTLCTL